jgi:hypothetical protein
MKLKLMRLPHGTNRNRTLRKQVELQEVDVSLVDINRIFLRFWHRWRVVQPGEVSG